jgi:hypothetical protein
MEKIDKLGISPGPWEYVTEIEYLNDYPYSYMHRIKIGSRTLTIAAFGDDRETEEVRDARVLAASRKMLEVLIEVMEGVEYWSKYNVPIGLLDKIKTVINSVIEEATNKTWDKLKTLEAENER